MSIKSFVLAATLVLVTTWRAEAQIFNLQRVSGSTGSTALDDAIDAEIQNIENDINEDIPTGSPKRLMEGMANSQAAAGKGLATDYISHFETFMIGGGVGLGADLEENKQYDSDLSGAGVMGGVMIGFNLSAFTEDSILGLDAERLSFVVNGFKFGLTQKSDEDKIDADLTSLGFMVSYKWLEGTGNRWFGWDGLRVHTGYQYSAVDLSFRTTIDETVNETTSGATISGTITGTPKGVIETVTHTVPIEVSSGVNFLYIVSFYGGLGTDINSGYAKGKADANADNSDLSCTGGACGGGQTVTVAAQANIDEKARVMPLFLRGFAGFQFNLPYFNVFVHGNKIFGTEIYSLATGVRLVF